MKRKSGFIKAMTFLLVFVFAGLAPLSSAWAATWYVDQTKPAGGNGTTPETAFQKIQTAIDRAAPDDTIKVSAGTYDVPEGQPGYPQGITINKSLTLQGESPGNTFIKGATDGIYCLGSAINVDVSGFTIEASGRHGIYCNNINIATIQNIVVCGAGDRGIYLYATQGTILNCTIISNIDGIFLQSSGNTTLANSIIAFNSHCGVWDYGTETNETAQNNCVYENLSAGDFSGVGNISGTVSANPRLIDRGTCNSQLDLALSPCINAGRIGDLDPDGTRADIGAWGGPGAASFWPYPLGGPIITNLSVTPASVPQGGTITINATGEIR